MKTAEEAFQTHVRDAWGRTEFANMHTHASAAEYKRAFLAGYAAATEGQVVIEYATMADDGTTTLVRRPTAELPDWAQTLFEPRHVDNGDGTFHTEIPVRGGVLTIPKATLGPILEETTVTWPDHGGLTGAILADDTNLRYWDVLNRLVYIADDLTPHDAETVAPEIPLLGQGQFDSLGIVEFMLACEDEFPGLTTDATEDYKLFSGPLRDLATEIVKRVPHG